MSGPPNIFWDKEKKSLFIIAYSGSDFDPDTS